MLMHVLLKLLFCIGMLWALTVEVNYTVNNNQLYFNFGIS